LVTFELFPSNVTGMVVANQDHPGVCMVSVRF
jgi:hypothetical protein